MQKRYWDSNNNIDRSILEWKIMLGLNQENEQILTGR